MKALKPYIAAGARHKLLFVSHLIEGVTFVDVSARLSAAIEPYLHKKGLSFIAEDAIEDIIKQNTITDPDIGEYVAIQNIGILFEPALGINIQSKFDYWARTRVLIVHNEGILKNNIFYLAASNDQRYSINLKDISIKTLYDEI